jgi:hypothetical protein
METHPGQDEESMRAAMKWHPKRPKTDEDHTHFAVHAAVEGLLGSNPEFAAIANEAEADGKDPHEVRHALGRSFLHAMFLANQETEKGGDPSKFGTQWIAHEFKRHLDPDYVEQQMREESAGLN